MRDYHIRRNENVIDTFIIYRDQNDAEPSKMSLQLLYPYIIYTKYRSEVPRVVLVFVSRCVAIKMRCNIYFRNPIKYIIYVHVGTLTLNILRFFFSEYTCVYHARAAEKCVETSVAALYDGNIRLHM